MNGAHKKLFLVSSRNKSGCPHVHDTRYMYGGPEKSTTWGPFPNQGKTHHILEKGYGGIKVIPNDRSRDDAMFLAHVFEVLVTKRSSYLSSTIYVGRKL